MIARKYGDISLAMNLVKLLRMDEPRWVLFIYWALATSSIIWGDYLIFTQYSPQYYPFAHCAFRHPDSLPIVKCALATFFDLAIAYIVLLLCINKHSGVRVFCWTLLPAVAHVLFLSFIFSYLFHDPPFIKCPDPRSLFLSFMTVGGFALSCLALYYEGFCDNTGQRNWKLTHARYLQFLNSSVWGIGFIFVGYLAWEYQKQEVTQQLVQHVPAWSAWVLLQLVASIGIGLGTMIYSINRRLCELEHKDGANT